MRFKSHNIGDSIGYDDFNEFGLLGCDYPDPNEKEIEDDECSYYDNECRDCQIEECQFLNHQEDKDVSDHLCFKSDIEFPAIIVIADTRYSDERFTMIPVSEAKENTKYGYNDDW